MKTFFISILLFFSVVSFGQDYSGQGINEKITVTDSPTVDLGLVSGDLTAKVDTTIIATKTDLLGVGGTVQGTDGNAYNIRAIDEGTATGSVRGEYSVDLQTTRFNALDVASGNSSGVLYGAGNRSTGNNSGSGGYVNQSTAVYSLSFGGVGNLASGTASATVGGSGITASGYRSAVIGGEDGVASGYNSFIGSGESLIARSYAESVFGSFSTDYTQSDSTAFVASDRLFNIGNGTGAGARSDAVTVLKIGQVGIGIDNFEANTTGELLQVNGAIKGIDIYTTNDLFIGGEIDMQGNRIANLLDPTAPQDAATKNYLDTLISKGVYYEVREDATVSNITGGVGGATTFDGVSVEIKDGGGTNSAWRRGLFKFKTPSSNKNKLMLYVDGLDNPNGNILDFTISLIANNWTESTVDGDDIDNGSLLILNADIVNISLDLSTISVGDVLDIDLTEVLKLVTGDEFSVFLNPQPSSGNSNMISFSSNTGTVPSKLKLIEPVAGEVNSTGTINHGDEFTINKSATGVYVITHDFVEGYSISVTPHTKSFFWISAKADNSVTVEFEDSAGTDTDTTFDFTINKN